MSRPFTSCKVVLKYILFCYLNKIEGFYISRYKFNKNKTYKMIDIVIVLMIIGQIIIGFLTVYQWFNLRGIPCIDNTMIDNLNNRVAVAVPVPVEE